MTVDQITAGSNGAWVGGAVLVILLIARGLMVSRKHRRNVLREALMMCAGLTCTSIGVILHRGYWNLAIFQRHTETGYADWAIDQRYIPSTAVIFIVTGIIIGTLPYGLLYFGRWQWPALVVSVLSVFVLGSVYLAQ